MTLECLSVYIVTVIPCIAVDSARSLRLQYLYATTLSVNIKNRPQFMPKFIVLSLLFPFPPAYLPREMRTCDSPAPIYYQQTTTYTAGSSSMTQLRANMMSPPVYKPWPRLWSTRNHLVLSYSLVSSLTLTFLRTVTVDIQSLLYKVSHSPFVSNVNSLAYIFIFDCDKLSG